MNKSERWRTGWAVGSTVALVLGIAFLLLQHSRHGWPFSLHHGLNAHPSQTAAVTIPSSAGSEPTPHPRHVVTLEESQIASIGLRTEPAVRETLSQPIRATATVVPDESRLSHVHTRVSGWIERLSVSTTGETVRAGQGIAGIFSQELLTSQNEYLTARRAAATGPRSLVAEAARARLGVLGMTDAEIAAIERSGEARRLVTVAAPRSGVVLRRGVTVGTAVDPSTELFTIADLSRVWVVAEVSEADIPSIEIGAIARLDFPASGRRAFEAPLTFLYPTLTDRTRTLRVRFEVDNPDGSLRPGLYGTANFDVEPRQVLTVGRDAVVDTGAEQHVFVRTGAGTFEPRPLKLGTRLANRVEVREGLAEGEEVVASGVFLLDSESRLRASGGGLAHAHGHGGNNDSPPVSTGSLKPQQETTSHAGHQTPAKPASHTTHGAAAQDPSHGQHQGH